MVMHPEITRFFMTIPEASELVIQAAAIGDLGDVLVLDMGKPIKILDVAKRLIAKSGWHIDIVFTGLRPGEKLHEVLFSASDRSSAAGRQADSDFSLGWRGKVPVGAEGGVLLQAGGVTGPVTVVQVVGVVKS